MQQINIGKEAAMEAEVKAARERAIIPLEIRMKQFRDMLCEKEVNATVFIILIRLSLYILWIFCVIQIWQELLFGDLIIIIIITTTMFMVLSS